MLSNNKISFFLAHSPAYFLRAFICYTRVF